MLLPTSVENLIAEFAKFPGIGRRSAERMVFDLLAASPDRSQSLLDSLTAIKNGITLCPTCGYFMEQGRCASCQSDRQGDQVLVVEKPLDVVAIEKAGGYRGQYHVMPE